MMNDGQGHLFMVGGGEDRRGAMRVLARYVELCGGPDRPIAVVTSASAIADQMWELYDSVFGELGVRHRFCVRPETAEEADDADGERQILEAGGVFMSGGSQQRLVEILNGTRLHRAMRQAFGRQGACLGGTSAGAAAMARLMLARGTREKLPDKRTARLESGLDFLRQVVIDQHFSERQRLARLLSAVAQSPDLIGVGIDEDTALIIGSNGQIEVFGAGAVTLIDGRRMSSNIARAGTQENLELIQVILHLLPADSRYDADHLDADGRPAAATEALINVLQLVGQVRL
ncbi:MAG: cyanophycinase [Pigmentiphaga sp.]|nr:cyanophycinase [Pigmentiphaga sp.]